MNRFLKPLQAALLLAFIAALTGCTLGQAAAPTPTAVDINAVMTSAASTAFAQLTELAAQASPTAAPTETQAPTNTPDQAQPTAAQPTTDAQQAVQATETPAVVLVEASPTISGLPVVPTMTPAARAATPQPGKVCNNSSFVTDVTVPDGTVMKVGEKFTKIWRIQNTGFCGWDDGYGIVLWNGPSLDAVNNFFSPGEVVNTSGVVDMALQMHAPWTPGEYISHWVMVDDTGKPFGTDLVVYIKVVP